MKHLHNSGKYLHHRTTNLFLLYELYQLKRVGGQDIVSVHVNCITVENRPTPVLNNYDIILYYNLQRGIRDYQEFACRIIR